MIQFDETERIQFKLKALENFDMKHDNEVNSSWNTIK